MERESHLNLPWRVLREKIVTLHPITDMVDYKSTFSEETFKKNLAVKVRWGEREGKGRRRGRGEKGEKGEEEKQQQEDQQV